MQTQAQIKEVIEKTNFKRLTISLAPRWLEKLEKGASVAVNGCCLTAVAFGSEGENSFISFDVIDETLAKTNLGYLQVGDAVNVERSLTMGAELGGHIVSGHIQSVAKLGKKIVTEDNCRLYFEIDSQWLEYIFSKGFIAVNGASLTVGDVDSHGFWLHLIPETLAVTNLGSLTEGKLANIEVDQHTFTTVETVKRVLARQTQ
ncbi:MAG: riboflavin synthase RibE [Idiomarinaceae bacterium HL-53]|nr:MAG: riboflavin synthase RibE [Idiomarinaceae bacterium HL-53]